VLAAFPFPLAQGSQVFVRDQVRALGAAGAEVTLFCYGSGDAPTPDGLRLVRVPRALSPRPLRAGPSPGKPVADALLAGRFAGEQRRRPFAAALAHNGEAALAALAARRVAPVPVVYVAHTLLGQELDAYFPPTLAPAARWLGDALDRTIAARADAVLALSQAAERRLAPHARGPVQRVPPGLDPGPAPDRAQLEESCARLGLAPGGFALYTGNVDRYQDLDALDEAARLAPQLPIVVATHGTRRPASSRLLCRRVSPREARELSFACAVAVLPRRRPGGFPVKLLNYMEAARPIVAHQGVVDGLEHDRSAWLLPPDAPPARLSQALCALFADPARAARLGRGARAVLESRHGWAGLAARTLALARAAGRPAPRRDAIPRTPPEEVPR
jgi:glycosyltransferase involved in cell wall biosynthesis